MTKGLAAKGIVANLVIVADYGMAQVSDERRMFYDDMLPKVLWRWRCCSSPPVRPQPNDGRFSEVAAALAH